MEIVLENPVEIVLEMPDNILEIPDKDLDDDEEQGFETGDEKEK